MMKLSVAYGNEQINFDLIRKNVKHINLTVQPDLTIFVSANDEVDIEEVKAFVESKGRWIISKLNYFKRHAPYEKLPREYVTGETFRYLGRQYKLKVMEAKEDYVRFFRGTIEMYVQQKEVYRKRQQLMEDWYEQRRTVTFHESLNRMHDLVKVYDIDIPELDTRQMSRRWGSYLPKRQTIILNKDLIIAPRHCIDYVVLHELLHFKYPDHDYHFFNNLQVLMPDWRERKRILDEEVAREI